MAHVIDGAALSGSLLRRDLPGAARNGEFSANQKIASPPRLRPDSVSVFSDPHNIASCAKQIPT
jgi:hypothetical protein